MQLTDKPRRGELTIALRTWCFEQCVRIFLSNSTLLFGDHATSIRERVVLIATMFRSTLFIMAPIGLMSLLSNP